jgi:hypothetical protein
LAPTGVPCRPDWDLRASSRPGRRKIFKKFII